MKQQENKKPQQFNDEILIVLNLLWSFANCHDKQMQRKHKT